MMADLIILVILALLIGCAVLYIYKSRKKGHRCVGCPYAGQCSGGCGSGKAEQ